MRSHHSSAECSEVRSGLSGREYPTSRRTWRTGLSYGIAGGIRFDADDCRNCDSIEFRRMRQNTHLALSQDPIVAPIIAPVFRPAVTLDHSSCTRNFSVWSVQSVVSWPLMAAYGR
jgi:hypothetical protein